MAELYTFRQPGTYLYLNHNLIEAFQFGALAEVKVEGEWDNELMQQVKKTRSHWKIGALTKSIFF